MGISMIIALSTDQATINAVRDLKALYPNEEARRIDQIIKLEHDLSTIPENPIKRITIIGHAHRDKYGAVSAERFSEHLIKILAANETQSPGFIDQLEAIDLLGCELGLVKQDAEAYASIVAKNLKIAGYNIPLFGFTNHSEKDYNLSNSVLQYSFNKWDFLGFSSDNNLKQFKILTKNQNDLDSYVVDKKEQIYDLLQKKETLEFQNQDLQKQIDEFYQRVQIQRESLPIQEISEFEKAVVGGEKTIKKMQRKITKNTTDILTIQSDIANLLSEIQVSEKRIEEVVEQKYQFAEHIAHTENPRTYFDQHSECNFMSHTSHKDTIQISKTFKQTHNQLKREKIEDKTHNPLHISPTNTRH